MKPILLKMISFGPFINETIDFRELTQKRIFLITGDTGSGKTTIFDAISVALFGESSGDERQVPGFKSDFEEAKDIMKLDFTFEVKGKVYRVVRIPRQMRKKLKGEGFTEELGDAALYEIANGEEVPMDYAKDVTGKIKEILGIDAKQFRQLVMIPQGQFRKLITESSDEREKILKRIFDVYKYQRFQKELEDRSNALVKDITQLQMNLRSEINHIRVDSDEPLYQLIQSENPNIQMIVDGIKEKLKKDKDTLDSVRNHLESYKKSHQQLVETLEKNKQNEQLLQNLENEKTLKLTYEAQKPQFEKMKADIEMSEKAFRLQPDELNLQKRQVELIEQEKFSSELARLKEDIIKKWDEINEEYKQFHNEDDYKNLSYIRQELAKYEMLLPKVIDYQSIACKVELLIKEYNLLKSDSKETEALLSKTQTQIEQLQTEVANISEQRVNLQIIKSKLEDLQRKKRELTQLLQTLNQLAEDEKSLEDVGKKRDEIQKKIELINEKLKEIEHQQKLEQAAMLSIKLEDGEPCPVCGSTHHPDKAKTMQNISDANEFDTLKKELEEARALEQQIHMEWVACEGKKSNRIERINEIKSNLNKDYDMDLEGNPSAMKDSCLVYLSSFDAQETTIQKEQELLQKSIDTLLEKQNQVAILKQQLDELNKKFQEESNRLEQYQKQIVVEETRKQEIEKEVQNVNAQEVNNIIKSLKQRISYIEAKESDLRTRIEELSNQRSATEGRINECEKALNEKRDAYEKARLVFETQLKKFGFEDEASYQQFKIEESEYKERRSQIEQFEQNVHHNELTIAKLTYAAEGIVLLDSEKLNEQINEINSIIEEEQKLVTQLILKLQDNQMGLKNIEAIQNSVMDKLNKHSVVQQLSNVANGGKGTNRITFERYILAVFLDEILGASNKRLKSMTGGRYELLRKNQSSDKRRNTGLDLEVFDFYTGKAREVNTLSGGEGFKAALALALGLADIAQSYAGGISLETMFVDEGFGSLSEESLDSAVNCLTELNEGGRVVGIISHVQELKDRIDAQLVVEKGKNGSRTYLKGI